MACNRSQMQGSKGTIVRLKNTDIRKKSSCVISIFWSRCRICFLFVSFCHVHLCRKVLKEISVGDLQPDETVDAMHEANLLRNLDHPGIVKFHDSFIDQENFCIITEYCEASTVQILRNYH